MWRGAVAAVAVCAAGCGGHPAVAHHHAGGPPPARAPARPLVRRRAAVRLALPARPRLRVVHVPILTYHRVHVFATEYKKSIPDETVEPAVFAAEMRALRAAGFHTIRQVQLFRALFHHGRLPRNPVLVTVDDGYVDGVSQILPVLEG